MKALRLHARGGPEQLFFEDAPVPVPKTGEVRLKVFAAAITPTELTWDQTYQTADGRARIPSIPGHDVSGVGDLLGAGVSVGDEVYGLIDFPRDGSAAEFATIDVNALALKPKSLDHVHAAAVPLSALTAWQSLFDHGHLPSGGKVLIHGAAGGVGAYAVQIARWHGAEVIATSSARHAARLKDLGVDRLIDYETARFEDIAADVDVVLDTLGGEARQRSWQTLRPGGTLVSVYSPIEKPLPRGGEVAGVFFIVRPSKQELTKITELIDAGKLRPFVEAVYPLSDGRSAFERALAGHLSGKIVLKVAG